MATAVVLLLMGREPWCPAGDFALWSFEVQSQHNSQHLLDWYTPSHISHGLLFFVLLNWLLPQNWKHCAVYIATCLEAGWEILENSPLIIERYRSATMAFDYFGDSVANSVADIAWCVGGFYLAKKLGLWKTLLLFLFFELFTLYCIRDNLTLNVIMLISPIDAIKTWQTGG
jgi:hypothetical protein